MSTSSHRLPRPTSRRSIEIALLCALHVEATPCGALFDRNWPALGKAEGDSNAYSIGSIGQHHVVLVHMARTGKVSAAVAARDCRSSFPNVKLALVVGVCGVSPFTPEQGEVLLGDVVVGEGVVQHDLGRQLPDGFVRKDTPLESLERPSQEISSVLAKLKSQRKKFSLQTASYLGHLQSEVGASARYPGTSCDRLFKATYRHVDGEQSCELAGCNGELIPRRRLEQAGSSHPPPALHFGLIASGDTVMKAGEYRDAIAAREKVVAFEMEGAGIWGTFPCVIIKGACDYADSHKSSEWQNYAAATAAACMKAFLGHWQSSFSKEVSLEEIKDLIHTAEVLNENAKHKIESIDEKLRANDTTLASTAETLLLFLFGLLWNWRLESHVVATRLNDRLDTNHDMLQSIIATDEKMMSDLQWETDIAHETMDKLKMAANAVQEQKQEHRRVCESSSPAAEKLSSQSVANATASSSGESQFCRGQKKEPSTVMNATAARQEENEFSQLTSQVGLLQEKYEELQKTIELEKDTLKGIQAQVAANQAKLEEGERVRREQEGKGIVAQLKSWIKWLGGS